ncbi:interleukin-2 receptor subunit beta [Scyliorhinus canicula]|uniref:interleukin-2 receptor subunit beta n=1 Tax=Scyliorhinus canicula TaxID=7830 RepID=UPI0018F50D3B|nr:interleukin-2 receptor subunit beta [Scyliorhinus canicula]
MKGFELQFGLIVLVASLWSSGLGCHSGKEDLKCIVDYLVSMTCCWSHNVSRSDPRCEVWVNDPDVDYGFTTTCRPRGESWSNRQDRRCNLSIPFFAAAQIFNVTLTCPRLNGPIQVARILDFKPMHNIKLKPPYNLTVVNNSRIRTDFIWLTRHEEDLADKLQFEMRYKTEDDQWKSAKKFPIMQHERRVSIDSANLRPERIYKAEIRVKISDDPPIYSWSTWSEWSHPVKWKSEVPSPSVDVFRPILVSSLLFAVILVAVGIRQFTIQRSKVKKLHWLSIPDPGKFFYELNSTYGGNFQKWLGTTFPTSFNSTEDLGTEISSVEISEIKDSESFIKQDYVSDSSGFKSIGDSSMSSFANQGYFWFSYPSTYEVDSCKVYFSYDRSGVLSGSEKSGSYRCLTSSNDSLYHSSLQYSPGSVFEKDLTPDRSSACTAAGGNAATGARIDGPAGEPEDPRNGKPLQSSHELETIGQLLRSDCPPTGRHGCPNSVAQGPLFEALRYPFVSLEDIMFKRKEEGVSRCGSDSLVFEEGQTEPLPATGTLLDTQGPQDGFRQESTSIFKTASLNLQQSSDAYLSLKEVQSKYSNQSI